MEKFDKKLRDVFDVFKAIQGRRTSLLAVLVLFDSDMSVQIRRFREGQGGPDPSYDPKEEPIAEAHTGWDLIENLPDAMLVAPVRWMTNHTEGNAKQDLIICIDWAD
jgi:hypothetical protein